MSFDDPAIATTYSHYLATVKLRDTALEAVEADLLPWCATDPIRRAGGSTGRLPGSDPHRCAVSGRRGVRLASFPKARPFMSFTGLVPRRLDRTDPAPGVHHPGRQCPPPRPTLRSGLGLPAQPQRRCRYQRTQKGVPPETVARSWAAQVRLSKRFRQLATHKNVRSVVAAAIAGELAGFLWAEMTAEV